MSEDRNIARALAVLGGAALTYQALLTIRAFLRPDTRMLRTLERIEQRLPTRRVTKGGLNG
jgi:hypothetical protein